jgi:hypothetical protein
MLWMTNLIALCALVGLLCVFNAQAIAAALWVWWVSPSPTFSHCFFVIPVLAYLVWGRRHALARLTPLVQALSDGGVSALLAVSTPVDVDTDETLARPRRALGALGAITVRGRS